MPPPPPFKRSPLKPGAPYRQTADKSVFSRPAKTAMYYRGLDLPQPEESRKRSVQAFVNELEDARVRRSEYDVVFEWVVHETKDGSYAHIYGIVTNATRRLNLEVRLSNHPYFAPMDEENPPRGPCSETIRTLAGARRREAECYSRRHGLITICGTLTASDLAATKEAPKTESGVSTKRPRGAQEDDVGNPPAMKKAKAAMPLAVAIPDLPEKVDIAPQGSTSGVKERPRPRPTFGRRSVDNKDSSDDWMDLSQRRRNFTHAQQLALEEPAAKNKDMHTIPSPVRTERDVNKPGSSVQARPGAAIARTDIDHSVSDIRTGSAYMEMRKPQKPKIEMQRNGTDCNTQAYAKYQEKQKEEKLDSERKIAAEGPKGSEHTKEKSVLNEDHPYHEDHELKQKRISGQKRRADEKSNVPEVQLGKSVSKCEGSADQHIGNGAASKRDPAGRSNHEDKRADTTSARAAARPPSLTFPDVFPPEACITERNVAIERRVSETLVTANILGDTELSEPVVKLYATLVQQRVERMVSTGRSWMVGRNRKVTSKRIVVVPPSISRRLLQVRCRYPEAGIRSEDYADLLDAELVLMPIQLESDGHWIPISAYFDCCEVALYDCFADESSSAAQARLDAASQVIKSFCRGVRDALHKDKGRGAERYEHLDLNPDEIRFVGSTSHDSEWSSILQLGADSKDSGVLVCQAMDCVIREISPFWFEPRHIAHIRKMMAIECSNKMLLMRKTDR